MNEQIVCNSILPKVRKATASAASYIKSELGKVGDAQIEEKEMNSLVSYVDKKAEELLVKELSPLIKEAGFITEEETEDDVSSDWIWIIDPLDGTTNFLMQIPYFCVSVALQYKGEIVMGVIHEVMRNEQFYATKGGGAFLDGERISVTSRSNINQILVATGFPYANDYDVESLTTAVKRVLMNTRGIRRLGAAALDLCYVAAGRLGAYYETTLNIWDIAAGVLIVKEAGGIVSDLKGGDTYLTHGNILACAPQFHMNFIDLLASV